MNIPGIPDRQRLTTMPRVKGTEKWNLVIQHHETPRGAKDLPLAEALAKSRREHFDLRFIPEGSDKALSFAVPKAKLPAPGERPVLALPQPVHTKEYSKGGPVTIEEGYGRGRVTVHSDQEVEIIKGDKESLRFNLYRGKGPEEFKLFRTGKDGRWLLHNVTKTRKTVDIPNFKDKYKEKSPDTVDYSDPGQVLLPKIDGAHVLVSLKEGEHPRVFSYREGKRSGTGLIEHTHKIPELLKLKTPASIGGSILRGELFAKGKDGRPLTGEEIGGMLNANVWKSRKLQEEKGNLQLRMFNVVKLRNQDASSMPYDKKLDVLKRVEKRVPVLKTLDVAKTLEDKLHMMRTIKEKTHPDTTEGGVLFDLKTGVPTKLKFRPDHDVYVRGIFKKEKSEGLGRAGGIEYSWTPHGEIKGRVGTGWSHAELQSMLKHPDKYIGRVAKVEAERITKNKVLAKPAFKEWHLDKNAAFFVPVAAGLAGSILSNKLPR